MTRTILMFIHIAVSLSLIGLVLLQHGRGADAGAAFGSGASQTLFGARGSSSFLTRATGILAAIFFMTSLTLAYLTGQLHQRQSVTDSIAPAATTSAPPASHEPADLPTSPHPAPPPLKNSESETPAPPIDSALPVLPAGESPSPAPQGETPPAENNAVVPAPVEAPPLPAPQGEAAPEAAAPAATSVEISTEQATPVPNPDTKSPAVLDAVTPTEPPTEATLPPANPPLPAPEMVSEPIPASAPSTD